MAGFARTMQDDRDGKRVTDANQGQFAKRLTMEEIHSLAACYARLGNK